MRLALELFAFILVASVLPALLANWIDRRALRKQALLPNTLSRMGAQNERGTQMTFVFAKNQLPGFAKGLASNESIAPLASDAVKVAQLRNVVKKELTNYLIGSNPLTVTQVTLLRQWLQVTAA